MFQSFSSFLRYLFYPHLGQSSYTNPTIVTLLVVSAALIVLGIGLKYWRASVQNPITKKLSRLWSTAAIWFGIVGVVLTVSRVEGIQYFSMRFLWVLWVLALLAFAFLQWTIYRRRHYEVLPRVTVEDPRDRYIPGKKRR